MSAELFHVIAQIIRRYRDERGSVPVCARYDLHEKLWSQELPYLFQTLHSGSQRGMSAHTVWCTIGRACQELAATHPEFATVRFSIILGLFTGAAVGAPAMTVVLWPAVRRRGGRR